MQRSIQLGYLKLTPVAIAVVALLHDTRHIIDEFCNIAFARHTVMLVFSENGYKIKFLLMVIGCCLQNRWVFHIDTYCLKWFGFTKCFK